MDPSLGETIDSVPELIPTSPSTPVTLEQYTIKKGDTLFDVLMKAGVTPANINCLKESCRSLYNLAALSVGRVLEYHHQNGIITHFRYAPDDEHILIIDPTDQGYSCRFEEIPYDICQATYHGVIQTTLWDAALNAGIDPGTLTQIAGIYDWEIDCNTEFRKGDEFYVLVEEKHCQGSLHHRGQVLAANIILSGQEHPAIFFIADSGHQSFYDLEGRCLRKNFLKAPLQYSRISSSYSAHRFHPILKIVRPHFGIDYAAPSGTPVRAVADATVTFAGWKSGYGRYIKLKHGSTPYSTGYGHLKGYAKGIKTGARVKQGDVIGYVGATGLATGPHLDYRVYYHDKPVNPNSIKTEPVRQLEATELDQFRPLAHDALARFNIEIAALNELDNAGSALKECNPMDH